MNGPVVATEAPALLTPAQARVLGTLMEKARTVPDSYPLTLNALLLGCNQKTSREPLMELDEAAVQDALDSLLVSDLVRLASGGRTARYEHNFQRRMAVPEQSAVLLGVLLLRGPQTAAELRLNCERWYRFADVSSVEGFLEELRDRSVQKGGPLAQLLAREPGAREPRWIHLLSPPPAPSTQRGLAAPASRGGDQEQRLQRLEAELQALRETVQNLCTELGMSPHGQDEANDRA